MAQGSPIVALIPDTVNTHTAQGGKKRGRKIVRPTCQGCLALVRIFDPKSGQSSGNLQKITGGRDSLMARNVPVRQQHSCPATS